MEVILGDSCNVCLKYKKVTTRLSDLYKSTIRIERRLGCLSLSSRSESEIEASLNRIDIFAQTSFVRLQNINTINTDPPSNSANWNSDRGWDFRSELRSWLNTQCDLIMLWLWERNATDFDATMRYVGTSAAINGTLELCVSTLSGMWHFKACCDTICRRIATSGVALYCLLLPVLNPTRLLLLIRSKEWARCPIPRVMVTLWH